MESDSFFIFNLKRRRCHSKNLLYFLKKEMKEFKRYEYYEVDPSRARVDDRKPDVEMVGEEEYDEIKNTNDCTKISRRSSSCNKQAFMNKRMHGFCNGNIYRCRLNIIHIVLRSPQRQADDVLRRSDSRRCRSDSET